MTLNPENPENANLPKTTLTTKQLDTSQFNPEIKAKIAALGEVSKASESELILSFPHETEPFRFNVESPITIGRSDPTSSTTLTLDLTPYFAAQLGVSRFHAEISFTNGQFYIKDMGSTNGTQINGKRIAPYHLVPFHEGDEIRLGHFPMIVG